MDTNTRHVQHILQRKYNNPWIIEPTTEQRRQRNLKIERPTELTDPIDIPYPTHRTNKSSQRCTSYGYLNFWRLLLSTCVHRTIT